MQLMAVESSRESAQKLLDTDRDGIISVMSKEEKLKLSEFESGGAAPTRNFVSDLMKIFKELSS